MTSTNSYIDGLFYHGPIMLKSIDGSREYNITNQVLSIDLYESVLSPIIKGEITIYDTVDLLQSFPIKGEEFIEFDWRVSENEKAVVTKLVVISVDRMEMQPFGRGKTYMLKLASPELYYSQRTLVQKKYKKTNSDIVKDLVSSTLNTKKKINCDPSNGIDDITITHQKPFKAIDFVRRRAISSKHKSSSYVFFENKDGYHFRTLESLFDIGKGNIGDRIYFYDTNTAEDVRQNNYRNILGYQHCNLATSLDAVQNGGLRNRVVSLDLVTGELTNFDYKGEDFKKVDKGGDDVHSGTFKKEYGKDISTQYFLATDSSLPEFQLPEKIGYLQGFVQRIISSLLWIHVYGDSQTTAGDVIELRLPDATGLTNTKEAKLISGNYLIAKARHMFSFGTVRQFTQSFELIKGSYLSK